MGPYYVEVVGTLAHHSELAPTVWDGITAQVFKVGHALVLLPRERCTSAKVQTIPDDIGGRRFSIIFEMEAVAISFSAP